MSSHALAALLERRIVAVIRAASPEAALGAAEAVLRGGIAHVEITFTVPETTRVIRALADRPDAIVGAGTVLEPAQARAALDAGARFLIAPNVAPDVAKVARETRTAYIPGAFTTTEILAARAHGADVVKVYPVGVVGPQYVRVIRDPLPDVPMLAAGGTHLDNVGPFLEAGCVAVGVGAAIADPALAAAGHWDEITRRAEAFVARIAGTGAASVPRR